jgi:hypothetical protein
MDLSKTTNKKDKIKEELALSKLMSDVVNETPSFTKEVDQASCYSITWYEKILLMFCKMRISEDIVNDTAVKCYWKKLFGKIFVLDLDIME